MTTELSIADAPLTMKALVNMLNGTALPARYEDVADAVATIKVGAEIGLPPMTSLNELFVVNGSVGMSGKAMQSLVFRAGHRIDIVLDPKVGTANAFRRDPHTNVLDSVGTYTFTWKDAIAAGLDQQGTYQKYPADMLGWKAVARAVRFAFPDVIMGYLPEEINIEVALDTVLNDDDGTQPELPLEAGLEDEVIEAEVVADMLGGTLDDE